LAALAVKVNETISFANNLEIKINQLEADIIEIKKLVKALRGVKK